MSGASRSFSTRLPSNVDKGSVVLDIGAFFTRCGLSGEPAPRYIVRSNVVMKPYGQVQEIWDQKYINRDELYLILSRFLQNIYLKYLMVNSKEYRVVVLESILCPSHFRNTLAKVLFLHLNVPYVAFVPSHLACTFTVGRSTALVVDVGYSETTILPVYAGMPMVAAWQSTTYGGKALQDNLKRMLRDHCKLRLFEGGSEKPVEAAKVDAILDSSLGDILTRMCFVRPKEQAVDKVPPDAKYPISSDCTLLVEGHIRDHVPNILFEDSGDDHPLPVCILEALLKSPIDCRSELSRNILVVGGAASLPGFNYRLQQELVALARDESQKYHTALAALNFTFHNPPSKPNCTTWVGGSILGASEVAVLERAVSKERFMKADKKLPDWTSCNPEDRERFRTLPSRKLLPSVPSVRQGQTKGTPTIS